MFYISEIIKHTEKKIAFFCHSMIHVFNSLMLIYSSKRDLGDFVIVMATVTHADAYNHKILADRIEKLGIRCWSIDKKSKFRRLIGYSDYLNKRLFRDVAMLLGGYNNILMVNFCWNQQFVCYPACLFYEKVSESIFIEEGATQYVSPKESRGVVFLKQLYGNSTNFWNDKKIKGIYVQNPDGYNAYLKSHIKKLTIDYSILSKENKDKIISVFDEDMKLCKIYRNTNIGIVFTQPLSEDGYISENEKKEIYRGLIDKYSSFAPAVLKIHPRDRTDYSDICKRIDSQRYPSELLRLIGIKFRYAVGISTSAVYSVEAEIKENTNPDFLIERRERKTQKHK